MKQLLSDGTIMVELALQEALKNGEESENGMPKWCKEYLSK